MFRCWLLGISSVLSLAAEVAGTPHPPVPGALASVYARYGNDFWSGFANEDDFRSVQTALGARFFKNWYLTIDVSNFTYRGPSHRDPDPGLEGRIDQITVGLARVFTMAGTNAHDVHQFTAGMAVKNTGSRGGALLQNGMHELLSTPPVYLPYEDVSRIDASIFGTANNLWTLYESDASRWALWSPASAMVSTNGQIEASIGGYLSYREGRYAAWGGLRAEARESGDRSFVIEQAFDQEQGLYAALGAQAGPISFDVGYRLGERYGFGAIGFSEDEERQAHRQRCGTCCGSRLGRGNPQF